MIGIIDESGKRLLSDGLSVSGLVIALLFIVAFYLLRAFGLYVMAKRNEDEKIRKDSYLAFIPFFWVFIAAKLAGNISLFGSRSKSIALIIAILFTVSGIVDLAYNVYCYYPLIKYFLQGNTVYINLLDYTSGFSYYFDDRFVLEYDLGISLSDGLINALTIISNIFYLLKYIAEIGMVFIYIEIFRKYWPKHVWAGSIFSIFGLFPIFVFAVRKNNPVKYSEYIYNQYRSTYDNINNLNNERNNDDPFSDFNKTQNYDFNNKNSSDDDPFSEFNDDKK